MEDRKDKLEGLPKKAYPKRYMDSKKGLFQTKCVPWQRILWDRYTYENP
jgi:hypothetical protein